MDLCYFTIPGPPAAKAKTLGMIKGHATSFNSGKTKRFMALVTLRASEARPPQPFDGPVNLSVVAVFQRPKKLTERYKDGRLKNGATEGRMLKDSKPDIANVIKGIEDGINGTGVWKDDSQVCGYDGTRKYWAAIGEVPHTEIVVSAVEDF